MESFYMKISLRVVDISRNRTANVSLSLLGWLTVVNRV